MKKIMYFIAAIMLLTSCCSSGDVKTFTTKPTSSRMHLEGYGSYGLHKFTYENHQYILIKGSEQMAMEHDPNCPCHFNY